MVYGKALTNAQGYLVRFIPADAHILIVGGGTGWVLEEITKIHPSGLSIIYIDASAKMTALANTRQVGKNKVTFITSPVESVILDGAFEVVLTPFLFDNFTDNSLRKIFSTIDSHMKPGGKWLHCDFQNTNVFWQKWLLKIMYFFFKVCCGIEASQLPDTDSCFTEFEYEVMTQKAFMSGFVMSTIYTKK